MAWELSALRSTSPRGSYLGQSPGYIDDLEFGASLNLVTDLKETVSKNHSKMINALVESSNQTASNLRGTAITG